MLTELREPLERLEQGWRDLECWTETLTPGQVDFRPGEGWSVRQVVDHVEKVEVAMLEMMVRSEGRGPRRRPWFRSIGLRFVNVILTRGIRVKIPAGVESMRPSASRTLPELFESARVARARSAEIFENLASTDLDRSAAKHPIGGALDFREALWFVEAHFRHHGRQIERIRKHSAYPGRSI